MVHGVGGWIALAAILVLGARHNRYDKQGNIRQVHPPSSIPFLALGAWILSVGWFGFNVMSAQAIEGIQGLVAIAFIGGYIVYLIVNAFAPIRMDEDEQYEGADLSIHRIHANPPREDY